MPQEEEVEERNSLVRRRYKSEQDQEPMTTKARRRIIVIGMTCMFIIVFLFGFKSSSIEQEEAEQVTSKLEEDEILNSSMTTRGPEYEEVHADSKLDELMEVVKAAEEERSVWTGNESNWRQGIRDRAKYCRNQFANTADETKAAYEIVAGDCGLGYNFYNSPSKRKHWRVAFFGTPHNSKTSYTYCPEDETGGCPPFPRCRFISTQNPEDLIDADVIVVFQTEVHLARRFPQHKAGEKRPYRVVLWKEALFKGPVEAQQRRHFDFELGTHHTAGLLNPHWLMAPSDVLSGILFGKKPISHTPVQERPFFAMSVISHCQAPSKRDNYIARLTQYLGQNRVHRYGECGDRELPPRPISNAAKLIVQYKFYFSFENTIQEGYMTEKLIEILSLPVVPVYYGDPLVLNITSTPSFIKALDFATPEKLGEYLLYLDANVIEYNKYQAWRTSETPFAEDYLRLLREKVAGPLELEQYLKVDLSKYAHGKLEPYRAVQRRAQCCRLCDENHVREAKANRTRLVPPAWNGETINNRLFGGTMSDEP